MKLGDRLWKLAVPFYQAKNDVSPMLGEGRFVVLDVDVTGVNIRKDTATGIAMLGVEGGRFRMSNIDWAPLEQAEGNSNGSSWQDQYRRIVDLVATDTVVTYNPRFVRRMIKRVTGRYGLPVPYGNWVDLAAILDGAIGREMAEDASLYGWQQRLNVKIIEGYSAIADVFTMAQLLEIAIGYCEDLGITTLDQLMTQHKSRLWMRGE
ncbi:MAG: hypothetical protein D4S02_14715 [Rhodocyclaceae bacterium]|nr:MAG: hypothetical protein D4S02_14715 [Rhodocyclaceae bacterium]